MRSRNAGSLFGCEHGFDAGTRRGAATGSLDRPMVKAGGKAVKGKFAVRACRFPMARVGKPRVAPRPAPGRP